MFLPRGLVVVMTVYRRGTWRGRRAGVRLGEVGRKMLVIYVDELVSFCRVVALLRCITSFVRWRRVVLRRLDYAWSCNADTTCVLPCFRGGGRPRAPALLCWNQYI